MKIKNGNEKYEVKLTERQDELNKVDKDDMRDILKDQKKATRI